MHTDGYVTLNYTALSLTHLLQISSRSFLVKAQPDWKRLLRAWRAHSSFICRSWYTSSEGLESCLSMPQCVSWTPITHPAGWPHKGIESASQPCQPTQRCHLFSAEQHLVSMTEKKKENPPSMLPKSKHCCGSLSTIQCSTNYNVSLQN